MEDLVQIVGKKAMCDSLQVAERFGKRHKNVLRSIDNQLKNELVRQRKLYCESTYVDSKGETRRMFLMNRQGFEITVMGFTGEKALEWRIKYSDAFSAMEEKLKQLQSQERLEAREQGKIARRDETDAIKLFVEYAKSQGSTHASRYYMIFSKLANETCNVTDRNLATPEQLINLAVCENIIRNSVMAGMVEGKYYKDIYQDARARLADFAAIAYIGQKFQLVKGA